MFWISVVVLRETVFDEFFIIEVVTPHFLI